jgi:protein-tyrosine phosphatase
VYAARKISDLTHADDDAWQACVLWSVAIRHAITHGEFNIRAGLNNLQPTKRGQWSRIIDEAEQQPPETFTPNGWVVIAFQAAWSAIFHTPVPEQPCRHYADSLATVIRIGHDTDTVAAIAGALLGARWGASAIPAKWRRILHGYPGINAEDLAELATLAANCGPIAHGWPNIDRIDYAPYGARGAIAQHPSDPGVYLGDAVTLDDLPDEIDSVVSLCLIGRDQVPPGREKVQFQLIDTVNPGDNLNIDYVLFDAAHTIADLRAEGRTVFVHCAVGQSRTPTVAIAYSLQLGEQLATARQAVLDALPESRPNAAFVDALRRIESRHACS